MLTESLNIYVIDKDGNKVTFPNVEGMQPAIVDVNLNRERMAGAPTNTSTLMYPVCLDSYWTKKEFIEIGSERYYVKQVPTSEKNTEDTRYKHEITFVSERDILENVFFFDCVTQDTSSQISDKPRTNTTEFSFYGDLNELVQRLNDSLSYSKIYDPKGENGFCIVIDDDVEIGEAKEVSMTDAYFATAMQEIYNVFEVPYYWVGKVCHVGYQENEITEPFEYGSGNGLISVQKTNAEFRLINRITGQGSADNIPYYYPNSDPNGTAIFETENFDKSLVSQISLAKVFQYTTDIYGLDIILCKNKQETYSANLLDFDNYLTKVKDAQFSDQRGEFTFDGVSIDIAPKVTDLTFRGFYGNYSYKREASGGHGSNATRRIGTTFMWCYLVYDMNAIGTKSKIDFSNIQFVAKINKAYKGNGSDSVTSTAIPDVSFSYDYAYYIGGLEVPMSKEDVMDKIKNSLDGKEWNSQMFFGASIDGMNSFTKSSSRDCEFVMSQKHSILIECCVTCDFKNAKDIVLDVSIEPQGELSFLYDAGEQMFIALPSGKTKPLSESGITITNTDNIPFANVDYKYDGENWLASDLISASSNTAKIKILGRDFINPISKLMPSTYRNTKGAERFYNAKNETYLDDKGEFYSFNNPYVPSEPLEGKQDFEDIKPTINGITNENGELFGEIAEVAFDDTDSDDLSIEDAKDANANTAKPVHPYFYVKLHKFSGENGFNLFKQGLAQGAMIFNFITGSCAGCSFKVQVSEGKQVDNHYEFENHVQVDEQGNIVAGDSGDKIKASNPIDSQQDTMTNSVWIALEKDNSTFGVLMPNATNNYRPQGKTELREGDKFVITNILLPTQYITAAEKRLEAALIKYMSENNDEKFTFSIKFSRIYLQEHPEIAEKINENTKLHVKYNNVDYPLFVSSYSRKSDDNILDEISVELSEKLTIAQNKSKEQMDSIMGNVNEQINSAIQNNNNNTSQGVSANDINSLKALLGNKLSRISDDTAQGLITFLQGLVSNGAITANGEIFAKEGLSIGEFVAGLLDGRGAGIDKDGNAEVESLRVRSYMQVMELIINRIRAMDGDLVLTEGDNIESVEEVTDAEGYVSYKLHLKQQWEGYYTAQAVGNVLKGVINTLAQGSGTYYTSWMLVKDVDTATNTITVDLYPDDETPAGKNFPPCDMMNIIRWGNNIDPKRQSCIYLSSTEGVIKKLIHVTKPILDEGNDGFIIGNLPEWLTKDPSVPVDEGDDAVYVKTLLYQNIHQIDYKGKRQPVYVDRGNWIENPAEPYHFEAVNSVTGVYETSDVWYYGCKWRCIKDCPMDAPKWNSIQWMQIEGNPEFSIEIAIENGGLLDFDYFAIHGTTLEVTGKIYNLDVTRDILDADVTWTRYTEDPSGTPRTESDNVWNLGGHTGKTLHLTKDDLNIDSSGMPSVIKFTARALLRDGVEAEDTISVI